MSQSVLWPAQSASLTHMSRHTGRYTLAQRGLYPPYVNVPYQRCLGDCRRRTQCARRTDANKDTQRAKGLLATQLAWKSSYLFHASSYLLLLSSRLKTQRAETLSRLGSNRIETRLRHLGFETKRPRLLISSFWVSQTQCNMPAAGFVDDVILSLRCWSRPVLILVESSQAESETRPSNNASNSKTRPRLLEMDQSVVLQHEYLPQYTNSDNFKQMYIDIEKSHVMSGA